MATPLDDRLAEIESRYEAVSAELSAPDVANDQERMRVLGRSFAELQEIVTPYREYRQVLAQAAEARQMEAAESEPEMAAFFGDEADRAEGRAEELRGALELLLIPKDPNDGKNVIVEIRAGTGGQEAALWAAELLDMGADRIVIHQATGMIAAQLNDTTSNALARLRAAAFASGRPMYDIAQDVVERRMRFDD